MSVSKLGPMSTHLDAAVKEIRNLTKCSKHWMCRGKRSIAIAATMLHQNEIIAIPTDTIYGLAGVVSSTSSIKQLYEIKQRDQDKPLSISVHSASAIKMWGVVDHLPPDLLPLMLPGPFTVILKRTPHLNPALNPNHDTVGIRVPQFDFIQNVSEIVGPLALTSANVSNEPSCLYPSEFQSLWPKLGGIFYDSSRFGRSTDNLRKGSTIVDLSIPNYYKIERHGVGEKKLILFLEQYGLKRCPV